MTAFDPLVESFVASLDRIAPVAANCANWRDDQCEVCGVPWQYFDVDAGFRCPNFRARDQALRDHPLKGSGEIPLRSVPTAQTDKPAPQVEP